MNALYANLVLLAAFVFLYSIVGGRLERTPINGAVVFTAFGLLFGTMGLGLLTLEVNAELLRTLHRCRCRRPERIEKQPRHSRASFIVRTSADHPARFRLRCAPV